MSELFDVLAAAALWLSVFFTLTAAVNLKSGRRALSPAGMLSSYPLFSFLQAALLKVLDLFHSLNAQSVTIAHLSALGAFLFLLSVRRSTPQSSEPLERWEPGDRWNRFLAGSALAIILALLAPLSLLIPVHFYDDHNYHMPMVASYFQNQTLADFATQSLRQISRPYAAELQLLNLVFLSRSDAWMELPNLLALGVSLQATYEIAKLTLGRKSLALLCTVLVLTAHQILLAPLTASNDLPFMALILCAFYWLIQSALDPSASVGMRMSMLGLCAGLATATKVLGICLFAAATVVLALLLITRRLPRRALLWFSISGLSVTALIVGNVFWENLSRGIAPVGVVPGEYRPRWFPFLSVARYYLYELCFRSFLTPSSSWGYGSSHYGYLYPLLFFAGGARIVHELLHSKKPSHWGLWTLALLTAVLFLSVTGLRRPQPSDQRFMIWVVPSLTILAVSFLQQLKPARILIGTLFASGLALFSFSHAFGDSSQLALMTLESVRHFQERRELLHYVDLFPEGALRLADGQVIRKLQGYEILEREAAVSDRVLYIGGKQTWMYPSWGRRFTRSVTGVSDLNDALGKIESKGYRFIVVEKLTELNLRDRSLKSAKALDYVRIANTKRRVIYKRPDSIGLQVDR
jgi:hypothetical protein